MRKKTLREVALDGKRVLVRVDFNVPLNPDLTVEDDGRLRASLPTIRYLRERGCRVILASHMDRPKGRVVEALRLDPAARRLAELLDCPVRKIDECVGPEARDAVERLRPGEVLLLENLRFHPEEEANDPEFARRLAQLADVFVQDAFGVVHRQHASVVGVSAFLPAVAGFLLEKELAYLSEFLSEPPRPFLLVVGGAKVSDKIGVLRNLWRKVDEALVGGGLANTFLAASGLHMGSSLVETDALAVAGDLLREAAERGVTVHLPVDMVVAPEPREGVPRRAVPVDGMPDDWQALDIGPRTLHEYEQVIARARSVFWNGPLGVFEVPGFEQGTYGVARAMAANPGLTVVGGGDATAAVRKAGVAERMSHLCTGGGAALKFLEGHELPGVACLEDAP